MKYNLKPTDMLLPGLWEVSASPKGKTMSHPYMKSGHKADPKWLDGLNKYKQKAEEGDTKEVIRNYDVSPAVTRESSYLPRSKKGK